MSDVLIQFEGLGKKYIIGHQAQRERYFALRDVIARGTKNFLRKTSDLMHGWAVIEGDELEEVWALRDVTFEVKRGERIAQLVPAVVTLAAFDEVEELCETARGAGGFGSTGQ